MSACDDFLFFDLAEDWQQIASVFRESAVIGQRSNSPIPAFNLGVDIDNSYLAVLVQTTRGKPTWRFGGELRQTWDFPKGQESSVELGTIQSERTALSINKLELIKLIKPTSERFNLRYFPPPWFKDVIVIAWKYTGEVENFVKDTLFDIGNQIGIGTLDEPDNLLSKVDSLAETLSTSVDSINTAIQGLQEFQTGDFIEVLDAIERLNIDSNIVTQLNQLDAGIFTLFEALKNLIPASEANQLEQNLRTRLDLGEEFL